jgi:two-component system cell cycle sensor histidine kinase/response regulator CckA
MERDMKILVLEDTPNLQRTYARMLRDHEVKIVGCPVDALEVIAAGYEPQIIVSDWDMPGGTGGDFCAELRRRGSNVPVIIVSGTDRSDHLPRIGANACLTKPFRPEELFEAMQSLL